MDTNQLELWLDSLPLDETTEIDGESVYLRVDAAGAELGVHFMDDFSDEQLRWALDQGFENALDFDAGWALSLDGRTLLLTRWVPGASGWNTVPEALEQLLNQVELLRSQETITNFKSASSPGTDEQRIRSKLMRRE
jgi:hypothetical protein